MSEQQNKKPTLVEIEALLESAVMDTFVCGGCESPLESDCPQCGLCGWVNPLVKYGFI